MIRLNCQYAGGIAANWEADLRFTTVEKKLSVVGRSKGDGGTYRLNRSVRLQTGLPLWRSCGHFLASLKPDWALPHDAASDIIVKGCPAVQGDVLAICWTRLDDEKECSFGPDVLPLSSNALRSLTEQWGSIRENQFHWHENFTLIADALRTFGQQDGPAAFLNSALRKSHADLETLISDIEEKASAWESRVKRELEKHEQAFEPVVARVLGTRPTSGLFAMQSYEERRQELRCFLASEMIRNGVVPTERAVKKRFSIVLKVPGR